MKNLQEALKKMDRVVSNWCVDDPILLHTWSLVEKVPSTHQTTIGIDTRSTPPIVQFNPNFVTSLPHELLEMFLCSEAFKMLLRHCTTRTQSIKEISTIASQVVVDEIILKNSKNVPGVKETFPMPSDFDLPNNNYMEDNYRKLKDRIKEMEKNISEFFGEGSESGDYEGKDSCGGKCSCEVDEDGNKTFSNTQEAMQEYLDPRKSKSNQNWGDNQSFDAEIQNMANEFKGSSEKWGKFSGDHVETIVAANTPKISAKEILKRFNTSVTSKKQTTSRMKINRRFDLESPGKKQVYTTKVLIAPDVSGSMSNEDVAEGFALINSALKYSQVDWMTWDTEITHVEKDYKKSKREFKITGRGGTCVDKVLEYADTNRYDGVIIFSDMIFDTNLRQPKNVKVFWLGTHNKSVKPTQWGYFATLDRTP